MFVILVIRVTVRTEFDTIIRRSMRRLCITHVLSICAVDVSFIVDVWQRI